MIRIRPSSSHPLICAVSFMLEINCSYQVQSDVFLVNNLMARRTSNTTIFFTVNCFHNVTTDFMSYQLSDIKFRLLE